MSYQPIKTLIDHFESFEATTGQKDLSLFANWLNQELNGAPTPDPTEEEVVLNQGILQAFGELSHHARHYVKKLIKDTPLSSWNDLVIITILYYRGSQRKSDAIQLALLDLSSGIEVLKRLLKKALIEEQPDPDDRRARRVELSPAGRELYEELQTAMNQAGEIVAGNLSVKEKWMLLPLLQKLVHFHQPIFMMDVDAALPEIIAKYLDSRMED